MAPLARSFHDAGCLQRDWRGAASRDPDTLIAGEKAVGAIVKDLSMSQPQVSKHLRVLSEVGLVSSRAEGRRRLYSLEPAHLRAVSRLVGQVRAGVERPTGSDGRLTSKTSNNKESRSDT